MSVAPEELRKHLSEFKVQELRQLASHCGVRGSGKKAELIGRLCDIDNERIVAGLDTMAGRNRQPNPNAMAGPGRGANGPAGPVVAPVPPGPPPGVRPAAKVNRSRKQARSQYENLNVHGDSQFQSKRRRVHKTSPPAGAKHRPPSIESLDHCLCRDIPPESLYSEGRGGEAAAGVVQCPRCKLNYHRCCVALGPTEVPPAPPGFICPRCRIMEIDPFYPCRIILHIIPLWDDPSTSDKVLARRSLPLHSPNVQDLRKRGSEVLLFCLKLRNCWRYPYLHEWPLSVQVSINKNYEHIHKPEYEHKRRDLPIKITPYLSSEHENEIEVTATNFDHRDPYFVALCLCDRKLPDQVVSEVNAMRRVTFADARANAMSIINRFFGKDKQEDDIDILDTACRLRLVCPISLTRIEIPVRGRHCPHFQCFDLKSFIDTTRNTKAFGNRWKCTECNQFVRPRDLVVDTFVEYILKGTSADTEAVVFKEDGSWDEQVCQWMAAGVDIGDFETSDFGASKAEPVESGSGTGRAIELVAVLDSSEDEEEAPSPKQRQRPAVPTAAEVPPEVPPTFTLTDEEDQEEISPRAARAPSDDLLREAAASQQPPPPVDIPSSSEAHSVEMPEILQTRPRSPDSQCTEEEEEEPQAKSLEAGEMSEGPPQASEERLLESITAAPVTPPPVPPELAEMFDHLTPSTPIEDTAQVVSPAVPKIGSEGVPQQRTTTTGGASSAIEKEEERQVTEDKRGASGDLEEGETEEEPAATAQGALPSPPPPVALPPVAAKPPHAVLPTELPQVVKPTLINVAGAPILDQSRPPMPTVVKPILHPPDVLPAPRVPQLATPPPPAAPISPPASRPVVIAPPMPLTVVATPSSPQPSQQPVFLTAPVPQQPPQTHPPVIVVPPTLGPAAGPRRRSPSSRSVDSAQSGQFMPYRGRGRGRGVARPMTVGAAWQGAARRGGGGGGGGGMQQSRLFQPVSGTSGSPLASASPQAAQQIPHSPVGVRPWEQPPPPQVQPPSRFPGQPRNLVAPTVAPLRRTPSAPGVLPRAGTVRYFDGFTPTEQHTVGEASAQGFPWQQPPAQPPVMLLPPAGASQAVEWIERPKPLTGPAVASGQLFQQAAKPPVPGAKPVASRPPVSHVSIEFNPSSTSGGRKPPLTCPSPVSHVGPNQPPSFVFAPSQVAPELQGPPSDVPEGRPLWGPGGIVSQQELASRLLNQQQQQFPQGQHPWQQPQRPPGVFGPTPAQAPPADRSREGGAPWWSG